METYQKLEIIKELFVTSKNTFNISILHDKSYKIVQFIPLLDKKKFEIYTIPKEIFSDGTSKECERIYYVEICRRILKMIRDNHEISIYNLYKKHCDTKNKNINIFWDLPKNDAETIKKHIKEYVRIKKENDDWDYDAIIWPTYQIEPGRTYDIKKVIDELKSDNLVFLERVKKDGYYNDFLFGKWNPERLIGDVKKFSNIPKDNFGDYDPYNNAIIFCAEFNSKMCLRNLLLNGSNLNYTNQLHQTPLHIAMKLNHTDCVVALLLAGCKTNIVDNFGNNAEIIGEKNNSKESIEYYKNFMRL